jgi:quinoprotein glucose dehydrogenase
MRLSLLLLLLVLASCGCSWAQAAQSGSDNDWPTYGGDSGGQRYSAHTQINVHNVDKLRVAWTFHTGTFKQASAHSNSRASFEATPVLWHGTLYLDTPFDDIFALDAATGNKIWEFNPGVDRDHGIAIVTSRGVALWHAGKSGGTTAKAPCAHDRVFVATLDRRLMARDALTGWVCDEFGNHGAVDLAAGMGLQGVPLSDYGFTSPPTVVGNTVVVGSSVADNDMITVASGAVRGYDAITGRLLWTWDPIPWAAGTTPKAGSAAAWSVMAADPARDLIYVPTTSPSLDYYGGHRLGDNRDADSIVALRASTGQRVWAFQLVHHDLWDYDTPSEPLLFNFRKKIPAVAVVTKTGMIFVFNRLTGEPLYPIVERPVPQTDLQGEATWPTQPFSTLPTLSPLAFDPNDIHLADPGEQAFCVEKLKQIVNKGIFTPPSTKETLLFPGPVGGANWGSAGIDPVTGTLYAHTNTLPFLLRQIPKPTGFIEKVERVLDRHLPDSWSAAMPLSTSRFRTPDSGDISPQTGAPYQLYRVAFNTPKGTLCAPQPWGALVAINLNTGTKMWTSAQGTMIPGEHTGAIGIGGPVVTAGGLVFIGATIEPVLRAFDASNGKQLWEAALPAPGMATPMSYQIHGRQFVVIAAGGNGMLGAAQSDAVVAFALVAATQHTPHSVH